MAIDVNDSLSVYPQVIQSVQNRRRIDEQQHADTQAQQQQRNETVQEAERIEPQKTAEQRSEAVYAEASAEMKSDNDKNFAASAYSQVQNQDRRDSLSESLGISVYA